jgi:hypothetical protein
MANIPQKVADRIAAGIKKFQPILTAAQAHEANEADTVKIITDMLSEIFGYDKYSEITSEKAIRGTFCDLAIKVNDVTQSLIEAKAIYQDLKEGFVKQAVDYASNDKDGIDWVVLTNGVIWRVYKVIYSKPVDHELVVEIKFLELDHRNSDDVEMLFLYTKESWSKSALSDFYEKKQALSRFTIGAVLLTESVLTVLKRELKRISPDIKIDADQIRSVLEQEVLKREVVECDKADEARKRIAKAANKSLRSKSEKSSADEDASVSVQNPASEICPPSEATNSILPPAK